MTTDQDAKAFATTLGKLAVAARNPVTAAQIANHYDKTRQSFEAAGDAWGRDWTLSLIVGNGAGVAAMSAGLMITGETFPWQLAVLSAAWLFALGLIVAAIGPLLRFKLKFLEAERVRAAAVLTSSLTIGTLPTGMKSGDYLLGPSVNKNIRLITRVLPVLELISALSFLAGLLTPLVSVTLFRG